MPDVARADAADQALHGLDADADRLLDALRLVREQHLDDVELLAERTRRQRRDRDDVRDAAHERLCQRRLRIFRRRADDQHLRLARARRLTEAVVRARVHEIENHLLPLGRQAVDFVEEQHAAISLFDETGLRLIRARERALDMAEDMRKQQLRVVVVVRAVERHKRRVIGKAPHRFAIGEHQMREQRLANARLADNQRVQAVGRIKNRRLRLLDLPLEAAMRADQRVKRLDLLLLNGERPLAIVEALIDDGSGWQHDAIELLERLAAEIMHGPPAELHDLLEPHELVELLRHIVAENAQRIGNLLRIEPLPLRQRLLCECCRLLCDIIKDPVNPFHDVSPS